MLRFKRMLKRKMYPTWYSQIVKGYKAYIFQVNGENPYFHFQIVGDDNLNYASLDEGIMFEIYEEACLAAERWLIDRNIL